MPHPHARTEILIGAEGLTRLRAARVLIAGLGGVGGYVAEALGRAGVGRLTLLAFDTGPVQGGGHGPTVARY